MRKILILVGISFVAFALYTVMKWSPETVESVYTDKDTLAGHLIEDFELEGFDAEGLRVWHLVGQIAHVLPTTDVFIERDVRLDVRGTIIDTDKVYWQNSKSRFITTQPVKIIHDRQVIEGVGALGRVNDEYLQINQNVGMSLKGPVVITCRGPFQIFRKENRIVFNRDVMISDTKGTLIADRMDVFVDSENQRITRGIASGNVRMDREGDVSYSDRVIYDAEKQSVKLVGTPKIEINKRDILDQIKDR